MSLVFEIQKNRVKQHFNNAAGSYAGAAVLYAEVAKRLMERLSWMRPNLDRILDVGSGTGFIFNYLPESMQDSQLIALDSSFEMLQQQTLSVQCVQATAEQLPFPTKSVDIVIASQLLHWCENPLLVLKEMKRILRPNGLLLFSTLGTDTLHELRASFAAADLQHEHVHSFFDMHDLGDALMAAGFADPVMESETFMLRYSKVEKLIQDLRDLGETNALTARMQGLMGKQSWQTMLEHYESYRVADKLPATYEIIYGHAWIPEPKQFVDQETKQVKVPIQAIKGRLG